MPPKQPNTSIKKQMMTTEEMKVVSTIHGKTNKTYMKNQIIYEKRRRIKDF